MRSMRMVRRVLMAMVVVATATLVPVASGSAAFVVPPPEGPWGYTYGDQLGGRQFQDCRFYRVAMGNGVAEELGSEITCADGLTFSPSGVLYGYTIPGAVGPGQESDLVTIDPATGAQTVVGSLGDVFFEGGMTFDAAGNLWLYGEAGDQPCGLNIQCLFKIDPATAAVTPVGGVADFYVSGLAADCDTLYATGSFSDGLANNTLYTIDTATGAPTEVGDTGLLMFTEGLDFGSDGTLYTIGEPFNNGPPSYAPKLATVDPTTGAGTEVAQWLSNDSVPNVIFGLAVGGVSCAPPAPEPVDVEPNFTG